MRSGPATAAVPGVTADLRVTPALSGRLLSPWSYEGVPAAGRVPSWGSGSAAQRPLGGLAAHPACPDRGGGIGSRGTGPPCLRGNRTASCPMCMDRRRLTALVFSGRLFNPRCHGCPLAGLHPSWGRRPAQSVWKHTLRLEQKENGGPSVFLPVVLRWQLQARRQRRQDFLQTEAAGVCAGLVRGSEELPPELPAFPTFISNGISGGFCDGASDPLTTA